MTRQKWGQNFLADPSIARRIVEALGDVSEKDVFEIGPGRGVLTEHIMGKAGRLTAVEIDRTLFEELQSRWPAGVKLINADFLKLPLPVDPPRSLTVVSNLPYSAANPILQKILDWPAWREAVVMVQKEVADRIRAKPGTSAYGLLTLSVQGKARVEKLFDVPPGAFRPRPKVTSTVLRLEPLTHSLIKNEEAFFQVAHAAFGQRRKTLLNSLAHGLGLEKKEVEAHLKKATIDPMRRPETLTIEDFNRLAGFFKGARSET